jgi:hypothetical protein
VLGDPPGGSVAVFGRGRELVLGGEPVVNRDDDARSVVGKIAAGDVLVFEVADDPAATVVEDERGERAAGCRAIDADGEVTGGAGDAAIFDGGDRFAFYWRAHGGHAFTRFGGREGIELGHVELGGGIEEGFGLGIEGHDRSPVLSVRRRIPHWREEGRRSERRIEVGLEEPGAEFVVDIGGAAKVDELGDAAARANGLSDAGMFEAVGELEREDDAFATGAKLSKRP